MKKLTKIIAMTLAVLMLAAMTVVTCGAASTSTGTVTVDKAVVGETVKFYRVLDYVDTTGSYEVTSDFKTFFDGEGYKTNDEIIAYLAGVADGADSQALAVEMGTFVKNNNIAAAAEKVAEELAARGLEVAIDDRSERAGVKFADADLIGWPLQVVIGKRGLADGKVEVKLRKTGQKKDVALDEVVDLLDFTDRVDFSTGAGLDAFDELFAE